MKVQLVSQSLDGPSPVFRNLQSQHTACNRLTASFNLVYWSSSGQLYKNENIKQTEAKLLIFC